VIDKTSPLIDCNDVALFNGEALAIAHSKCFIVPWSARDFRELLVLPSVFGFVIYSVKEDFDRAEVVLQTSEIDYHTVLKGFVLCLAAIDQCEILTICVLPEWRHLGIASKLLRCVTKKAENIGVKRIFLEVAENNNLAQKLYINQGFEEFGRRKKYYKQSDNQLDAIQFFKTIGC
jgi:ribosomal protein S18 acetylase RimI-like enzyme